MEVGKDANITKDDLLMIEEFIGNLSCKIRSERMDQDQMNREDVMEHKESSNCNMRNIKGEPKSGVQDGGIGKKGNQETRHE